MTIKGIEERIKENYNSEELKKYSSFVLIEYQTNPKTFEKEIIEVLPLENNIDEFTLENANQVITDIKGNVLVEATTTFPRTYYKVLSVENDRILLLEQKEKLRKAGVFSELQRIETLKYEIENKKLKLEDLLFDINDNNISISIKKSTSGRNIFIVNIKTKDKNKSYLYSMEEEKIISPVFSSIEEVENTKGTLLKYTDEIKSNELIHGKAKTKSIIGYISVNGILKDVIYDEGTNSERYFDLSSHPNHMQYNSLKNSLSRELDIEVEEEIEKIHQKNAILKRLELSFKNK